MELVRTIVPIAVLVLQVVILIKDKSAHSIVLKDGKHVEIFIDFIQSIVEKFT